MEELKEAQLEFYKILCIAINTAKVDAEEAIKYLEEQRNIIQQDIAIDNDNEKELVHDNQSRN